MPLLYEIFLKSFAQSLGFLQIFWLYAFVFYQFHNGVKSKFSTSVGIFHMHMDGQVLV